MNVAYRSKAKENFIIKRISNYAASLASKMEGNIETLDRDNPNTYTTRPCIIACASTGYLQNEDRKSEGSWIHAA